MYHQNLRIGKVTPNSEVIFSTFTKIVIQSKFMEFSINHSGIRIASLKRNFLIVS